MAESLVTREWDPSRPTFEQFVESYRNPQYRAEPIWRVLLRLGFQKAKPRDMDLPPQWRWDGYYLGLRLHVRVPDGRGFFGPKALGPGVKGARWCWPWRWYRLYYAARFPGA